MKLRFGELPDDHPFPYGVRSTVDWLFKCLAWIALTAAFGVAAKSTSSWALYSAFYLANTLLSWFVVSGLSWLLSLRRYPAGDKTRAPSKGARRILSIAFFFLALAALVTATTWLVNEVMVELGEFQSEKLPTAR